jgi:site-specific DNA-methyltransferase (adenine-specific)
MPYREEIIGDCRLLLGDCRDILPQIESADHTISDPPYEKEAHRKDRRVMRKDGLVAGALSFDAMNEDLRQFVCLESARICKGWFIAFCQAEGVSYWRDCIETARMRYKAPMIWVKPDGMPQFNGQGPGMGYESMVAAWAGEGHSKWNGGGRHGVFIIPKGESERNVHETQKPIRLMSELVKLFSNQGETVLDPFMGSASTGVACVKLDRKFIGIEKDEKYFEASCKRIEEAYKQPRLFTETPQKPKQDAFL